MLSNKISNMIMANESKGIKSKWLIVDQQTYYKLHKYENLFWPDFIQEMSEYDKFRGLNVCISTGTRETLEVI